MNSRPVKAGIQVVISITYTSILTVPETNFCKVDAVYRAFDFKSGVIKLRACYPLQLHAAGRMIACKEDKLHFEAGIKQGKIAVQFIDAGMKELARIRTRDVHALAADISICC